jgi:dihydroxy-acid dehydratase
LRDGDMIAIDAEAGVLDVEIAAEELDRRRQAWRPQPTMYTSGTLWKYAQTVGPAEKGAVTHPGAKAEVKSYAEL